ncbi:hypothetical protein LAV_00142 [Sphingobium phage Lacusarx]|uniref:Uncharacterized protein n=1 Tax=Sphingobium phage Lacusarx TaxID=1980139 RepID=A0A1W6DWX2_9CAUD|nr:hypothetical protein FDH44_gp161 [Sphingobium phage Lacusarx]ARK07517.1 hypothetical protein LAV_00142 [Sphingobium phage Lacusarx]
MTDRKPNPIPFNPDTMTISQMKLCAESLRTIFHAMPTTTPEGIVGHLEHLQDTMLKRYGAPA